MSNIAFQKTAGASVNTESPEAMTVGHGGLTNPRDQFVEDSEPSEAMIVDTSGLRNLGSLTFQDFEPPEAMTVDNIG